jgi:hypothetical protein
LVPPSTWEQNERFANELKGLIKEHRISSHPLMAMLNQGSFSPEGMKRFHLEFRHAFAQNFTDALIQVMVTAGQLESRQGAIGKVAARFLIQLNVLDELGFEAGKVEHGEYAGDPHHAHYIEFDKVISDLGISPAQVREYVPSKASVEARRTVEEVYGDHVALAARLALAESVFSNFAGPWATNMKKRTDVATDQGYHAIHVEHEGTFIDDDHSEDMWFVLRQAVEPSRYDELRASTSATLEIWARFCDSMLTIVS